MQTSRILLIDDETEILDILEKLLRHEGFSHIYKATTGKEALTLLQNQAFDLMILDVSLPDMDGFELCTQIRKITIAPILFLTARSSDLDKLTGLRIGGDDYITKPFQPLEVMARVHAQLRRQAFYQQASITWSNPRWDYGSLIVDQNEGTVLVHGEEIRLTKTEFALLTFFANIQTESLQSVSCMNKYGESLFWEMKKRL